MSLQTILEEIFAAGTAQVQEIEAHTQTRTAEILAQAHMEAQQLEEDSRDKAVSPAVRERARIIHKAHLDALRIVGGTREEMVDVAIHETREQLAAMRNDPVYPSVLDRLTREALAELDIPGRNERILLFADPRDKELLMRILIVLNLDLPVNYDLNCWGGLIAKTEDGRVVAINTLNARLERATPFLRSFLAGLFEE